jgi:hypothetical protein
MLPWKENLKMGARFKIAVMEKSGMMMQLCAVKPCDTDSEDIEDLNHSIKLLLELVKPWWNKMRHVIYGLILFICSNSLGLPFKRFHWGC